MSPINGVTETYNTGECNQTEKGRIVPTNRSEQNFSVFRIVQAPFI